MTALGGRFWRLFASSTTSNLADGIGRTALPLLAATLTRDPLLIAGLTTLAFLPWLLLALPAGALVDRSDRRRAMVGANAFRALALAALGVTVLLDAATITVLYVVAFAVGVAETVYDSAARALLPQVVRRDQLERGNSLLATEEIVGNTFLGAPIGSLLFTLFAAAPVLANAGGFALAALLMLSVVGRFRPERTVRTSVRADIRDGVGWLRRHRFLRGLTVVSALTAGLGNMTNAVLVLYALEVLGLDAVGFGLLVVATGMGGLLGGLLAPVAAAGLGRAGALAASAAGVPPMIACMGLITSPAVGFVLFGLAALLTTVWNVLSMSLRQAMVPGAMFGRVQGAYRTLVWGAIPLGALAGGALAAATSVPTVFVVSGAANLLVAGLTARLLRRHRHEITTAIAAPESRRASDVG